MRRFLRSLAVSAACVGLLILAQPVQAVGVFSSRLFTGDADSGVSSTKTYTHAVDLATDDGGSVINGVTFVAGALVGSNYTLTTPNTGTFQNSSGNVTGGSADLVEDFFFLSGSSSGVEVLTLTGLTVGERYITTFYNEAFGGPRVQNITTSDGGSILGFDQDFSGTNNGNLLQYDYVATATSISFTFDSVTDNASFHQYGFSNEVVPVPEPATLGMLALGGLAFLRRRRVA